MAMPMLKARQMRNKVRAIDSSPMPLLDSAGHFRQHMNDTGYHAGFAKSQQGLFASGSWSV
jgi:hypothetical protein